MDNEYEESACYERLEDYEMPRITNQQLHTGIRELRIVLLGVEDSEDKGLYGECRDMLKLLKEMNGTVKSDHTWIHALKYMVYALFILVISAITTGVMGIW